MADIIYRNPKGALKVGSDSDSDQVSAAVYRSRAGKKLKDRDGTFVEVSEDGSERVLFRDKGKGGSAVKRTSASELTRTAVKHR